MKIAVLSANLGNFDIPVDPVEQDIPITFHRFTDSNFPPITGLTPRFQYRIPKMFGWQMFPGYDVYIWLDGSVTLSRPDSARWMLDNLGGADAAFFKHPWRKTIKEEVDHLEEHLKAGKPYITSRYKNGLHKEQYAELEEAGFVDEILYASTAFIYQDSLWLRRAFEKWWGLQSRYYTCDQVALPYAMKDIEINILPGDPFKSKYLEVVSKHK